MYIVSFVWHLLTTVSSCPDGNWDINYVGCSL